MKGNLSVLNYLYKVMGKTRYKIGILVLVQVIIGIAAIFNAMLLGSIINAAVSGDRQTFFFTIVCFALLMLFVVLLRAFDRYLDESTRSTLENRFKERIFECILQKNYSEVSAVHSGEWLNLLTSDTSVIAGGLVSIIPGVCGMAVKLLGAIGMIIVIEPMVSFIIIPGGIVLILFSYFVRKHTKVLHKKVQEEDGNLRVVMQDSLSSLIVVHSYAIEDVTGKRVSSRMMEHRQARMQKMKFSNLCNVGYGILMNGAFVVGALYCGYGILNGSMDYGTFTSIFQLIGHVQSPFANITGYLPQWYAMIASTERVLEAENLADRKKQKAMSISELRERYEVDFKGISMENVSFKYHVPAITLSKDENASMPVVFDNISLRINKGEYVAFVGNSGCGKSTIMKLLLSLYSLDKGSKYVITDKGKEVLDTKWQRLFAYVPQENYLMSGTIREIVTISDGRRINDDEALNRAIKIACADSFVNSLDKGLDTRLGERGQGLSEGQMQRIAIARAIFSDAPFLLLDEATSALDERTEKKVLNNLKKMTNKTVLIVTHRPAALAICDRVIEFREEGVIENARVL